jgi:8-amino-3,8-dideoxy-alpha-D-manno-octulosonate transaminase
MDVFERGGALCRYGLNDRRRNIFRVDEFEKKIAQKVGAKHALLVCNGTAALKLALLGCGVKAGDEVVTQSFTFIATVEAILELGARPVITEVDKSLNMDPADLARRITSKTRAIVPVHMAGVPAKMAEILAVAKERGVPVVEDSAQALGGSYRGKPLGTWGRAGIYSMDIAKVITTGEGGILVTDDTEVYLAARAYSDHGHEQNPKVPRGEDTRTRWGFNYKATEIQGAIGLAQLAKLDMVLERQRGNKKKLKDGLQSLPGIEFREVPDPAGDAGDTLVFFVGSRARASAAAKKLAVSGFGTKNLPDAIDWHYAGTWTHIFQDDPEYRGRDLEQVWRRSTELLRRAIALPVLVQMSDERIAQTVAAVASALAAVPA